MKRIWVVLVLIGAAVGITACTQKVEAIPQVDASAYKSDLETLSGARIFFGHQSVGRYIIQGVTDLAKDEASPLRIVQIENVDVPNADGLPGLFHTNIGANSDPAGKIRSFTQFVERTDQPAFDVALLKLCYVDLGSDGVKDPHELIEQYAQHVAEIRAARPNLLLIHVTSPLRYSPPGKRTALKRLFHVATEEDADNVVRNAFNVEFRKRFAGEPMFDIAEVESTLPDGQRSFFTLDGEPIYTMANIYTDDGGHPNAIGKQYISAAFVHAIAEALRKRS